MSLELLEVVNDIAGLIEADLAWPPVRRTNVE